MDLTKSAYYLFVKSSIRFPMIGESDDNKPVYFLSRQAVTF